jgi:predicted HTH transcriptional regulator
VALGFTPDFFEVRIFDRESKRLLDGRVYRRESAYGNQGVTWKERAEDMRAAILAGENEYLELKQEWNGENPNRFKEAVTAFSNSPGGGVVIFGVKNAPIEILGVSDQWTLDQWGLTLNSAVRDSVSPPPKIEVSQELIPERIIVVQVSSGIKPPYSLKNRGVLVRAGSSNRVPEQYELVELVKRGAAGGTGV